MSEQDPSIRIIARWALYSAFTKWAEEGWEFYLPTIGEFDYDRVVERMKELLPLKVHDDDFNEAYTVLADRAEDTE